MIFSKIITLILRIIKQFLPYGIINIFKNIKKKYSSKYSISFITSNPPENIYPLIFNESGNKIYYFFLKDNHMAHIPYGKPQNSYFLWDRYNFGLDVHFYTHNHIFQPYSNAIRRYGWLLESEAITPLDYKNIIINKYIYNEYNYIFSFSQRILDQIPNSKFVPAGSLWYGIWKECGGELNSLIYKKKKKNISILCSNKKITPMQQLRNKIALECKKNNLLNVDTFGTFDGGIYIANISDTLTDYRFSFIIENNISSNYFTEKILNCFGSMTIPIYYGAPNISDFFNSNGIISLNNNDIDNLLSIINLCSEKEYLNRLEAVKDNFNRVLAYCSVEEYIFENYLKNDLFFKQNQEKYLPQLPKI